MRRLLLGITVATTLVAPATASAQPDDRVTLCHATGSGSNPFVTITVSAAGAFHGHLGGDHQDGEDIIPPFEYQGTTYSQNWDATGQAIFDNGCERVTPSPTPSPAPTPTPTEPPQPTEPPGPPDEPGPGPDDEEPVIPTKAPPTGLAFTGARELWLTGLAVALGLAGAALIVLGRRRLT